jgi:oxaloacetate decarboxylase alpha subunit
VIQYALGIWGKEGAELMDPDVKDRILSRPRAREWVQWEQPQPSLHEIRQKYGASVSDEELIMRYFAGEDYVNALPNGGKPREYLDGTQPLVKLIERLSKRKDSHHVYIKRPEFSITMEKKQAV